MSGTVSLLLGVHAHQPVGNFPEVLEDAHLRCYQPFLRALYRYPEFRFSVHFSGWLLDYLFDRYPEDMALLREMVMRGQVEVFGAGDTEPVLAVIPERDRVGQIQSFSDKLAMRLGQRPEGAWLTERVWEATVVPALAGCGIRYITVDDYHFLCAGKDMAELKGYFTTEEGGKRLDLFPISEALRYRLPFSPAHEVVAYIESLAGEDATNAAIYFDDIEKFGIWPETYEWVYERGWLDQFIQGVLASPVIRTRQYCDYHNTGKTRGIVYLPTTSYIEMNEWTLPAGPAGTYASLVQRVKLSGAFESEKPFLRGGIWKNFFSRYPESNWMHKRMLGLSARLATLPEAARTTVMQQKLYEAQANDAYWHGLFGGLYLPHLRRAVYNAMVELEAMLDRCEPRRSHFVEDTDLDGTGEIYLQNGILQIVVRPDVYASICEWDAYALRHNFGDTLRRQTEHYYRKISQGGSDHANTGEGIVSAHDRVNFKHAIDDADMAPDQHPRGLFVDFLDRQPFVYEPETGGAPAGSLRFTGKTLSSPLQVHKHFSLDGNRLQVSYRLTGMMPVADTLDVAEPLFSTEINLAMPSCDGPAGRYRFQGSIPGGFGQPVTLAGMTAITLDDDVLGGSIMLETSAPVSFHAHPHFSVSQSEGGFEKIMQAVTLRLAWPVQTPALTVTLTVVPHRKPD